MLLALQGADYDCLAFEFLLKQPTSRWENPKKLAHHPAMMRLPEFYQLRQRFGDRQKAVFLRDPDLLIAMGEGPVDVLRYSRATVTGDIDV